ncbi:glycosyl hydrolase family 28-related protein [Methyloceanibacter sp. wino2]|uniref:glycosyl hydrolase family 28-related protein n=1 Tax=Methyloceanibacter sp. wino2 TaxID=2170729 RepID=UPI000D3E6693|nr:glycosyl hydrolase family 28-related protein [Methyloceanibacter sp. wino2]
MTSLVRISALLIFSLAILPFGQADAAPYKGCNARPTSKLTVNVKTTGARGDGRTDDTKAIQRAIDKVAGTGGTVYLPAGTYMVRAERNRNLALKSKMTLRMAKGATIKMFPTAVARYAVLKIANAEDVNVIGGTLQGDRQNHKGRGGEWGMGVFIGNNLAQRITISDVRARNMWGDGFYVGNGDDISFCSVIAENNRRQGLSIVAGNRILVSRSVFRDTRGTRPGAGIDLEPDKPHQKITDVRIESSVFVNNEGGGIIIAGKKARISRVQIQNNEFDGARPLLIEYAPRVAESHICSNRYKPFRRVDMKMFEKVARPKHTIGMQKPCKGAAQRRLW